MYIYACKYPNHSKGGYYYYVGKHERTPEGSKTYFGSGKFCRNYEKKYGKDFVHKNVQKVVLMSNIPNRKALCYWEQVHIRSYREQYPGLVMNWTEGGDGGSGLGEKHSQYNHTVHSFRNVKTGKNFKGTMHNFTKKYSLCRTCVSWLVHGKRKHHKYWVMEDSDLFCVEDIKRMRSEAVKKAYESPEYRAKVSNAKKGSNNPQFNINSTNQVYKRAYEAGDIKVGWSAFYTGLKDPNNRKHDKYTKIYNKHTITKG